MGEGRKSRIQRPIIRSARTARGKLNGSRALEINTSALSRHLLFSRVLGKSRVSRRLLKKKKKKKEKDERKTFSPPMRPLRSRRLTRSRYGLHFFFFFLRKIRSFYRVVIFNINIKNYKNNK